MTSLSSLTASFSAEKRCKGKHFFSFHQNFFQVFFRRGFSGRSNRGTKDTTRSGEGCQPFIVQRLSLPKAGAKVRTLSDSATHSTHFFSVKQGFTTETFWKGTSEGGKTAHLYIRAYAITFIYGAQTRRNFYPKGRKFLFGALPVPCGRNRQRFGLRFWK